MIRTLVLLPFITIVLQASAQHLYFPKHNRKDSLALREAMPGLAREVVTHYTKNPLPDKASYFDGLFRYQIVARDFKNALQSLDSVCDVYRLHELHRVIGIQYRSYIVTNMALSKPGTTFDTQYPVMLNQMLDTLSTTDIDLAIDYLLTDIGALKTSLTDLLAKLEIADSDSIELATAEKLCRTYNAYTTYCQITPHARKIITQHEQKHYIIEDSIVFTLPTGITLSGVMARKPNVAEPLPVILMYDIYPGLVNRFDVKTIASKNYVGIVVNTRGKYLSPHPIEPFEHDAEDAYHMIDWISKQPWCNGSVGMYGGSYLGFAQWSAVKKVHPALKTIVPQVAVGSGIDFPMHNNVFMNYTLRWIHYVTNNKTTDDAEHFDEARWNALDKSWYLSGKSFRKLDSLDNRPNEIFQRWLNHPSYDAFWQRTTPYQDEFSEINIPVLTTTGYYDDDQRGALYYFNEHHRFNQHANHYLLIGPYDHGGGQGLAKPELNGYTLDSVAVIHINETVFQWFDYILKGGPKPALLKDKINYQVMGTNSWKHAPSLQAMNNDTVTFYLSDRKGKTDYLLDSSKPSSRKKIRQTVLFTDRQNADINTLEFRVLDSSFRANDAFVFTSNPIEDPFDINGTFLADLKITINKKDLDFNIKLYEQQADGQYMLLSSTIARASYAKDRTKRQLLTPGKEEHIPLYNGYFVSRRINKGSRVIAVVGVNKNRDWQVNYGTGKDVSDESIADGKVPLEIQWNCTSSIRLPIKR